MAYTLTQARTLLTSAELALFDHSRAEPIKALTQAQLRAKVSRARALRDKYRDLYRRQTVALRSAPARKRSPVGVDNQRTQRKAELFGEVLGRFEARLQVLASQAARARPAKGAAATGKAAARKVPLKAAVKKALGKKPATARPALVPARSSKAPAAKSPTRAAAKRPTAPSAPLDMVAQAERGNPLKQRPINPAIHAHSGAQTRRAQGKRDSR